MARRERYFNPGMPKLNIKTKDKVLNLCPVNMKINGENLILSEVGSFTNHNNPG